MDSITGEKIKSNLQENETISVNFQHPEHLPLPMKMMALSGKFTGQQTLKADGTFEDADLEKTHKEVKQKIVALLDKGRNVTQNPEAYANACMDVLTAAEFEEKDITEQLKAGFVEVLKRNTTNPPLDEGQQKNHRSGLEEEEELETSKSHREGGFQVSGKTQAIFGTSIVGAAALVHPAILAALVIFLILPGALKQSQSVSKHTSRQRNNKDQHTPDSEQKPVNDTITAVQTQDVSVPEQEPAKQRGTKGNQVYNTVLDELKSRGENPQAKLKRTGNRDDLIKAPTNEISGILKKTAKGNTTPTSDQLTQNLQNQQTLPNTHDPLEERKNRVDQATIKKDLPLVAEMTKAFEETAQQSAKNQGKGQQGR